MNHPIASFATISVFNWSALAINEWFIHWNPTIEGLVYLCALISSVITFIHWLRVRSKQRKENVRNQTTTD